jgi:hypothetical protein
MGKERERERESVCVSMMRGREKTDDIVNEERGNMRGLWGKGGGGTGFWKKGQSSELEREGGGEQKGFSKFFGGRGSFIFPPKVTSQLVRNVSCYISENLLSSI